MPQRSVLVVYPGNKARQKSFKEDLGVITNEKEGRAWMAPAKQVTVFRMIGNRPVRASLTTLVHANTDLPLSLAAGPAPARGDGMDKKLPDPRAWEGMEVSLPRWRQEEILFEAEAQQGEGRPSSRVVFDLLLSLALLGAALGFAVRVGSSYLN